MPGTEPFAAPARAAPAGRSGRVPNGLVASTLCASLIDGPARRLDLAHASRRAWFLSDRDGTVVMCVMFPGAVRLPFGTTAPAPLPGPSLLSVGDGAVTVDGVRMPVARWRRSARPRLAAMRGRVRPGAVSRLASAVPTLVGRGAGLTPYADDVLCGALVALRAADPPSALPLVHAVQSLDLDRRTTAVSAALLRLAMEGWCIDELAEHLTAVAAGTKTEQTARRLAGVGHSSGAGLLEGVRTVLAIDDLEVAA